MQNRLRELRQAAGLTQRAVAAGAGIQPAQVSRIEGGMHCSYETLAAIANVLNVEVSQIVPPGTDLLRRVTIGQEGDDDEQ